MMEHLTDREMYPNIKHCKIVNTPNHSETKSTVNNTRVSINPVSLLHERPKVDPAITTNIQASGSSNIAGSLSDSESETRLLVPMRDRSFTNSSAATKNSADFKNTDRSFDTESRLESLSATGSHSKLTDLAHKVSDYIFSTHRSIDIHNQNSAFSADCLEKHTMDSANSSPIPSRESSHVSLSSLARTGGRTLRSKRRSFLFRSSLSPTRDSANNINHAPVVNAPIQPEHGSLNHNNSSTSLNSHSNCHFACNDTHETNKAHSRQVKETHYVHVEYDPITRKRVLNTYEILKDLGSGQHGKVKLAKDIATGKLVAIKIVDRTGKPSLMINRLSRGKSETQEDKIRKEIAIMKKCDHPHVVKLIEVLDAENSRKIYLVLEYLEKGEVKWQLTPEDVLTKIEAKHSYISGDITISDCSPEPLLSLKETKKIFLDVVSGLEYLHHQGIIHRDIKPSNLLVGKNNEVKISDFGVSFAAQLDGQDQDDVELARTAGTPAFLAPELCNTEGTCGKVTYKIDIWALGITLYCLIFGDLPFYAESEFKLFEKINKDDFKVPDMTRWRVAEALSDYDLKVAKDLLLKLLDKNAATRIEIDDIKTHPFIAELLKNGTWVDEYAGWNKEMKIKVSNEEVDGAVVGLGNRIKKKLSEAFRRRKLSDRENSSLFTSSDKIDHSQNNLLKSIPLMGLKDDCSYILSEENNKSSSHASLSFLAEASKSSALTQAKPTIGLCVANATRETKDINENTELDDKTNLLEPNSINSQLVSTSSPIREKEKGTRKLADIKTDVLANGIDDVSCAEGNYAIAPASCNVEYDGICRDKDDDKGGEDSNKCDYNSDSEDNYDYRNDLMDSHGSDLQAVNLTINPSFASLDSFYDDSYTRFVDSSPVDVSHGYSYGSFSNRNTLVNRNSMRSSSGNKGSPKMLPFSPPDRSGHNSETRESLSMLRKSSNSPSTGSSIMVMGQNNAINMNSLRGKPVKSMASSNQPAGLIANMGQKSPIVVRNPARGHGPMNPMFNNMTNRDITAKNTPMKRAIFSNGSDSESSDDGDNDDQPFEFNKMPNSAHLFATNQKTENSKFNNQTESTSANTIRGRDNGYVHNNGNTDSSLKAATVDLAFGGPNKEDRPKLNCFTANPTKSSIYGTKLNLVQHAYGGSSDDDDDNDDSDNELYLSFGGRNSKFPRSNDIETPQTLSDIDNAKCISLNNVFSSTTPTIVDVPENIFETRDNDIAKKFAMMKFNDDSELGDER